MSQQITSSSRHVTAKNALAIRLMFRLCLLPLLLQFVTGLNAQTAQVGQEIVSPVYINIYWDTLWDNDSPSMTKASIDSITQAVIGSQYMSGLAEYGVRYPSFGGGFLPEPACTPKPSAKVGFWDPFNPSVSGFIQCEYSYGPSVFRQSNVILNVILPPYAVESDAGQNNFCAGQGSYAGFHYHGLPTLWAGYPIFTVVMSNAGCGGAAGVFRTLTHEMVEAATDPYPLNVNPLQLQFGAQEIADKCETLPSVSFPGPGTLAGLAPYWSNAHQACVTLPVPLTPPNTASPFWESLGARPGIVSSVSQASGRLDAFVGGVDGIVYHKAFCTPAPFHPCTPGWMTTWESLGTPGTGAAALGKVSAVSWQAGRLDLFVRGRDNMVYHKFFDLSTWGPSATTWELLGGPTLGDVTAASWGPNRLDVFMRRLPDNTVMHRFFDGSGWSAAWETMGQPAADITGSLGRTPYTVTAVSWGSGRLDLFLHGTDNGIYHKSFDGTWEPSQTTWESLGGATVDDVTAVSWGAGRLDVFVRGTDDVIYHKFLNGNLWAGWESLGGATGFKVSAAPFGVGSLDVFVRGTNNVIYHKTFNGSAWVPSLTTWNSLGGAATLGVVSPVSWGPGRLDVFAAGADTNVYHAYFNGAWLP